MRPSSSAPQRLCARQSPAPSTHMAASRALRSANPARLPTSSTTSGGWHPSSRRGRCSAIPICPRGLPAGWTAGTGPACLRRFELHRDLIAAVSNTLNGTAISTFTYLTPFCEVAARPAAVSCFRPCAGGSAGASPSRSPGQCTGEVRGGRANVLVSRDCMGMRTSERQVRRRLSQFEVSTTPLTGARGGPKNQHPMFRRTAKCDSSWTGLLKPHPTMPPPLVEAHRGDSSNAPENTLAAFRRAVELAVPWIELDVHPAADGTLMVIHDDRVDRTTDGAGAVADLTVAQLARLDACPGLRLVSRENGFRDWCLRSSPAMDPCRDFNPGPGTGDCRA